MQFQKILEVSLRILHAICAILFTYAILGVWLFGQPKPQPEKNHVSCLITNHPFDVTDAQTKKTEEKEDWHADCTITRKGKVLYGPKPLVLPYPASFNDATTATEEFIKKGAAEILKQLKKEEKGD